MISILLLLTSTLGTKDLLIQMHCHSIYNRTMHPALQHPLRVMLSLKASGLMNLLSQVLMLLHQVETILGNMRLVSTIMFNYSFVITHNNNNNEKDDDDDTNIVIIIITIIIVNAIIIIMESLFLDQSLTRGPLQK